MQGERSKTPKRKKARKKKRAFYLKQPVIPKITKKMTQPLCVIAENRSERRKVVVEKRSRTQVRRVSQNTRLRRAVGYQRSISQLHHAVHATHAAHTTHTARHTATRFVIW